MHEALLFWICALFAIAVFVIARALGEIDRRVARLESIARAEGRETI